MSYSPINSIEKAEQEATDITVKANAERLKILKNAKEEADKARLGARKAANERADRIVDEAKTAVCRKKEEAKAELKQLLEDLEKDSNLRKDEAAELLIRSIPELI